MSRRQQADTDPVTYRAIAAHPNFWRGVVDGWQGKPPDEPDEAWHYERGRAYANACRGDGRAPLRQYVGDKLNEHLVRDLAHYFDTGAII